MPMDYSPGAGQKKESLGKRALMGARGRRYKTKAAKRAIAKRKALDKKYKQLTAGQSLRTRKALNQGRQAGFNLEDHFKIN
jgi:hypothetical protein